MGVLDTVKDTASKIKAGNDETEGLGRELAAKADMVAQGRKAISGDTSAPAAPAPKAAPVVDSGKRYGDKKGEKRIDVKDALKPLGSYKHGTDYVPKTGIYKLHEGEAVKTKDENTMDARTAMEGITGKAKAPKKIHEIVTKKSDDGKMIHTHRHHHPHQHPDETHVSNDLAAAQAHLGAQEPNMSAQPPAMPEAGAPAAGAPAAGPTPGM
jgi:hypothetical protein